MAGNRQIRALNVAEKPSVAKAVAGILSRNQLRVREGRSRYNKIFEFDYTIRGQPIHMLFTSVTGHLMELEFDQRYRKWHSCDPSDLYQAPVHKTVPQDKLDIKRTLQQEARGCQWLILWLDCDREGENIAFEVIEVCAEANPNLNTWRARFSALIDRDIHEAVQNLVRPNQSFAEAVDARQEIDLRIGASFTRFQTMLLKDAFNFNIATEDRSLVLSYGPCQVVPPVAALAHPYSIGHLACMHFPTLGFVVERYWEIQAHEPEEFWTINCSHNSEEGIANFSWMRGHMFNYTCAVIIYEMCVEEPIATVTMVRQQEKLKYPPYPLSTIELEKRASRYFRLSSEHTMKVAEELYQSGFISYPRTETDSFSARTDLHAIVQEQQAHPVWGIYAQRLLDPEADLWKNPGSGGHDDKAHPPIHPTKFSAGESGWSQDHYKVYELVVRHFLACVSQPAVSAETTVEVDIAGEMFSASGRVILAKNYLDVYRFESWGGSMIPTYMFGQQSAVIGKINMLSTLMGPSVMGLASSSILILGKAGEFYSSTSPSSDELHSTRVLLCRKIFVNSISNLVSNCDGNLVTCRFREKKGHQIPITIFPRMFTPTTLTLDSGVTRPPPLLSEADLLSCMDKAGIGTDATMHDHIKKLLDRFYATKDANTRFSPTNLAKKFTRVAKKTPPVTLPLGSSQTAKKFARVAKRTPPVTLPSGSSQTRRRNLQGLPRRPHRYELWKPYLRSKMEDDMRAVSLGTKRKAEILASCLQEMKACFLDARVNKVKLFEAMEIFFDRTNRSGAEEQQTVGGVVRCCGLCHQADMALKRKPFRILVMLNIYPQPSISLWDDVYESVILICSDMCCLQDGKFMVSCLGFPLCRNVVWLPGSISEATVTSNICNLCSPGPVFLIQFKFRQLEIPPNYSVDHLGCVGGCDDTLRQLTEICGTGPRNLSGTSASVRGQTPTTTSARNMASNVQCGVCSHCRQTGHSSNDCPSQVSTSGRARSRATNHTDGMRVPQYHVVRVENPAYCEQQILQIIGAESFIHVNLRSADFLCIWEDMVDGGAGGQNALHTHGRGSNATSGRRGGRGRGRRGGGRGSDTTFVSATGGGEQRSRRSSTAIGPRAVGQHRNTAVGNTQVSSGAKRTVAAWLPGWDEAKRRSHEEKNGDERRGEVTRSHEEKNGDEAIKNGGD
uniref:DNA topoisomerase n=1 Tax=Chenopodium quinoa TaxID=63459 RepID=A0A803KNA6_CHEQI